MRTEFSAWLIKHLKDNPMSVFLTGDLGFNAFEVIQNECAEQFINVGVAEQNMIGISAGMARNQIVPICYSIAPFLVFRPYEQIRVDICLHDMNVKLVGNGGGYGYGIMGATHHALEDIAVLTCLPNMRVFVPLCDEDVASTCEAMMEHKGPSYLRLNKGSIKPLDISITPFQPFRKITQGEDLVCISIGPIGLNALKAFANKKINTSFYALCELPVENLPTQLILDIQKIGRLIILEEHRARGGAGENIIYCLAQMGIVPDFRHIFALGYPSGLYGSQDFHQQECGLDPLGIETVLEQWLTNE